MMTRNVHTIVLGAGPAGLTAAYVLAKAGKRPVILEKDDMPGGLMRSIKHGEFVVDVGRKELYNRLEKVDRFWRELLGEDYRSYAHRGGILYDGVIFDQSPAYRGFRRGMPWGMFLRCAGDFALAQLPLKRQAPRNVEEYFYRTRGRWVTRAVSQGFQEKLTGVRWADIPLPRQRSNGHNPGLAKTVKDALVRTFSSNEVNTFRNEWRHPAKGTGQICDTLAKGIVDFGGQIEYTSSVAGMTSSHGRVSTVTAWVGSQPVLYHTDNVVSSLPMEFLARFLLERVDESAEASGGPSSLFRKRTVVLVYLFVNGPPRFPHAWLIVTCPKTRVGRITNYAGFNGEMVPTGKTALCLEYYCFDEDPLLERTNEQLTAMALEDCAKYNLAETDKVIDSIVIRFPGADASQNRHNWQTEERIKLLKQLKPFENLYHVSRSDLDIATLAGMEAAEAIISQDRTMFDQHVDPTQIGIRSGRKPFEFENPAAEFLSRPLAKQAVA